MPTTEESMLTKKTLDKVLGGLADEVLTADRALVALHGGVALEYCWAGVWRAVARINGRLHTAGLPTPSTFEDRRWRPDNLPFDVLSNAVWRLPSSLMIEKFDDCMDSEEFTAALNSDQLISLRHVDHVELLAVLHEGVDNQAQMAGKIRHYLMGKLLNFKTGVQR